MRFTTVQINALIMSVVMLALQIAILWFLNGELKTVILDKDLGVLALIFAPTAALAFTLRTLAPYKGNGEPKQCCRKNMPPEREAP